MAFRYDAPQPVLHTVTEAGEKITLRPAELKDAAGVLATCTDPETLRWTTVPLGYDHEMAAGFATEYAPGWWQRHEGACWVVADAEDTYVGQLDLRIGKDPEVADVGFVTAPYARGRGYMTAALRAAAEYGLRELGVVRVEWKAHVGNEGSRRVAEKAGFSFEGVQRSGCAHRGERRDAWTAALVREDLA
ncbi:GNAT family N-acetyltransferase [Catellatospora tritici]|uniref:GNAT family N-acetyltransferase n=1 Tax=Catellatospora tritici TaxID=2851566 RepID=UPI001C2D609B|nr:GNAT family protein [Catellatospora tritici]MBV1849470.1 GNAT family N-acetyltransferase [Catellatospora tritici]MBV1854042.1 GNAT family N-acetyltransferase [Catellatospora tritici]